MATKSAVLALSPTSSSSHIFLFVTTLNNRFTYSGLMFSIEERLKIGLNQL